MSAGLVYRSVIFLEYGIIIKKEVIRIQKINEAYERMVNTDVKYRFSIDMASLKG